MPLLLPPLLAAAFLLAWGGLETRPAAAEESLAPPRWMSDVTRAGPGDFGQMRPVKLEYTLEWNNVVNAGRVEITIDRKEGDSASFVGDASGRSTGLARVLWPYDFRARSVVDLDSLRPLDFRLSERERNEQSDYTIEFEPGKQILTKTSRPRNGEPRTRTTDFEFDFGHDMLSSAFYLRSQPLEPGDVMLMVVTPFDRPYLARFEVLAREQHRIRSERYDAIKLEAKVARIQSDYTLRTYDKLRSSTFWLSDDEDRVPLEVQSQIHVGFVSARLADVTWKE